MGFLATLIVLVHMFKMQKSWPHENKKGSTSETVSFNSAYKYAEAWSPRSRLSLYAVPILLGEETEHGL